MKWLMYVFKKVAYMWTNPQLGFSTEHRKTFVTFILDYTYIIHCLYGQVLKAKVTENTITYSCVHVLTAPEGIYGGGS